MKREQRARLARTSLDFRFEQGGPDALTNRPTRGWIRAIRDALGMSGAQLAHRMGITQPAVAQLERSEANGLIGLDALHRAADALDCELVYALVPRTSLEAAVRERAQRVARREVGVVDTSMKLGERGLNPVELHRRVDEYAAELIASGRLWDDIT
jgi:predicted DNA-binding mobile mystery protein A